MIVEITEVELVSIKSKAEKWDKLCAKVSELSIAGNPFNIASEILEELVNLMEA